MKDTVINTSIKSYFGDMLIEMEDIPYVYGGSDLNGLDCSGSISKALNEVFGTDLRYNADTLYKRFFTRKELCRDSIKAVFFVDRETGKAVHVAGNIAGSYYLNMSSVEKGRKGTIRTLETLRALYPQYAMDMRALDENAWLKAGGLI